MCVGRESGGVKVEVGNEEKKKKNEGKSIGGVGR